MKLQELFEQKNKYSKSIQARKKRARDLEKAAAEREDKRRATSFERDPNFKDYYPKEKSEKSEKESVARLQHSDAEDEILHKAFGDKEFVELSTGANSGEKIGKQYNAAMTKLGFMDMEVDRYGKPAEAWGPKPELKTKWERIGKAKNEAFGGESTTFYQLKDHDKVIVLATKPGALFKGIRYLFIEK